jgi:hypothetical protein
MKTIQFSNLDLDTQKKIVLEHKIRPIMDGYEEIDYEPLLESFTHKLDAIGFNVKGNTLDQLLVTNLVFAIKNSHSLRFIILKDDWITQSSLLIYK